MVVIEDSGPNDFIEKISNKVICLSQTPVKFARELNVIPCQNRDGMRIDFILAGAGFEETVVSRAINLKLEADTYIRICTAEDLIIMKSISLRSKDIDDVQGILNRQGRHLDSEYIILWLEKFEKVLDRSDLVSAFRKGINP